ncbi:UNKNOWN [Stylonychia lemnae]|uniref:Transmembrane protein n=1 Tax=Stylonychia lemnae TaxID=5949 RepID=A0A077ZS18_STYLE|nr:UNKNOWN [Stylonychia lemnae]|eukprot:CDW72155.1 UNKNOWN [Stylonychia lemnae]
MGKNFKQHLKRFIKNQDTFGHPITLRYKNQHNFNSLFGGIVSIILKFGFLAYSVIQLLSMYQRDSYQINRLTSVRNMGFDTREIMLNRTNFDFGVSLVPMFEEEGKSIALFEYFKIQVDQTIATFDGQKLDFTSKSVPMKICTPDRLNGLAGKANGVLITEYFACPEDDFQFKIFGSQATSSHNLVNIKLVQCESEWLKQLYGNNTKRKCKSYEEFIASLDQINFNLMYLQQTFDESDFDQPIKNHLKHDYFLLNRNITYFTLEKDYNMIYERNVESGDAGINIDLMLNDKIFTTTRQVRTLLDMLAEIGGFYTILFAIAKVLLMRQVKLAKLFRSIKGKIFKSIVAQIYIFVAIKKQAYLLKLQVIEEQIFSHNQLNLQKCLSKIYVDKLEENRAMNDQIQLSAQKIINAKLGQTRNQMRENKQDQRLIKKLSKIFDQYPKINENEQIGIKTSQVENVNNNLKFNREVKSNQFEIEF